MDKPLLPQVLNNVTPDSQSGQVFARDPEVDADASLRQTELVFIWIFWGFIAVLTFINSLVNTSDGASVKLPAIAPLLSAFIKYLIWALLTPPIFRLASRCRFERKNLVSRVLLLLILGMAIAVCVTTVMDCVRYVQAVYFMQGVAAVWNMGLDNFTRVAWRFWSMNEFVVYLLILSAGYAHDYFVQYRTRHEQASAFQAQAAHLRAELADSRLNALRTQINPHFLFNTLNTVSSLIDDDPQGAQRMIARLSALLRDTLEGADLEVPLERELVFVRRYIEIMQTRFQDRLQAVEVIAPDTLNALVPNLILQPLVENAIKHGIDKLDGMGRIEIQAQRLGDMLQLRVMDNGTVSFTTRLQDKHHGGGLGLKNTQARLIQSYGGRQAFSLHSNLEGGVIAEVMLPFHTQLYSESSVS